MMKFGVIAAAAVFALAACNSNYVPDVDVAGVCANEPNTTFYMAPGRAYAGDPTLYPVCASRDSYSGNDGSRDTETRPAR